MDKKINNLENNEQGSKDDEIDFGIIYRFVLRHIFTISSATILFAVFFIIYAFLQKRTWQGQFQIVLNSNQNIQTSPSTGLSLGSDFISEFTSGNKSSNLKTEVGILESPLVLMPIFELVNKEKNRMSESTYPDFYHWKDKNLRVKLKKGTSILNITYKDQNRDLIIPVLEKMSAEYQIYSGRSKKRKLSLTKKYLKDQINVFRDKASSSLKKTQKYAMDQDLTIFDIQNKTQTRNDLMNLKTNNSTSQINKGVPFFDFSNIGIESVRIKAVNEINNLSYQLKKLENLGDNFEELKFISLTIPELADQGLPSEINNINTKLIQAKSIYKPNDLEILSLEAEKANLIKSLKESSIGILKAKKMIAESLRDSATRPKGVILKYKELMREAGRDESTLIFLEDKLRSLNLEEKIIEDPWELITQPTLRKYPIAPSRKKIAFIGIFVGLIIGVILSIIKDRNSGLVYERKYIEDSLGQKILEEVNLLENFSIYNDSIILSETLKLYLKKQVKILCIGIEQNNKFEKLKDEINNLNKNVQYASKLIFENDDQIILIFTSLKNLKIKDLDLLKKTLALKNKEISGIFLID